MLQQTEQYIINESGKKIGALIDIKVFRKMLAMLDEYQSIKEYRSSKIKTDEEISRGEFITLSDLKAKISKKKKGK